MTPMTMCDLKTLELWTMTERANRPEWFVAAPAGPKPRGDRGRPPAGPLLEQAGTAVILLLALALLGVVAAA